LELLNVSLAKHGLSIFLSGFESMRSYRKLRSGLRFRWIVPIFICICTLSLGTPAFAGPPAIHTVTFYESDSGSDPVSAFQTGSGTQDLTLFADLSPQFSDSGYTFAGWNTAPDGTGTPYSDGESYSFSSELSLYAQWSALPAIHTVTFYESDSGSDPVSAFQTGSGTQDLTLFADLSPQFSDSGYTFAGWNTAPDGTGTPYSDGESYSFSSELSLYAQWASDSMVSCTFLSNGASGILSTVSDPSGTTVLLPSSNGLSDSGYNFTGWNTAANGSGTQYSAGSPVVLNSNETFYAQWSSSQYLITLAPDGGTVSSPTLDFSPGGNPIILPTPTNSTEYFSGWYTAPSGGTLVGLAGASYEPSGSLTIYAQWSTSPTIQITFADNGGTGSIVALGGDAGSVVALPGSSSLSMSGYTLSSWNTSANGTGTSYSLGEIVTLTNPLTLYAQWTAGTGTDVIVSFEMNGGSGSTSALSGVVGSTITLPGSSSLLKVGYTLASWNTATNGTGTSYSLGQSVTLSSSLTLYAQWKKVSAQVLYGAIGLFTKNSSKLTAGLKDEIAKLATAIKTKKYLKVTLYGYGIDASNAALDVSLSKTRATNVANYLRTELRAKKVSGVAISAAGEGAESRKSSATNSRVEVFVP
jgi:outer membrane protein OmpA-like peptidoglycan-associated protein